MEGCLQTAREITDRYLEAQKEVNKSLQSTWAPYVNTYEEFWNKWASPRTAAEIYERTVSNFANNAIVTTRIPRNGTYQLFQLPYLSVFLLDILQSLNFQQYSPALCLFFRAPVFDFLVRLTSWSAFSIYSLFPTLIC
jgi:hypothetical protein